jgi:hypothetical protein
MRVKNLPLKIISKIISEQISLGSHESRLSGQGVEFDQYRPYAPGDEPKSIDWKKYVRTHKLFNKHATAEKKLCFNLVLDTSYSMSYAENEQSRWEYARLLGAAMCQTAYAQNEDLRLVYFTENAFEPVFFGSKINHLIANLENKALSKNSPDTLQRDFSLQKEIIFVISDFFGEQGFVLQNIKKWAAAGNEIYIVQILGIQEQNFDFQADFEFEDLENKIKVLSGKSSLKEKYLERFKAHQDFLKGEFLHRNIRFVQTSLGENPAHVLNQVLKWSS